MDIGLGVALPNWVVGLGVSVGLVLCVETPEIRSPGEMVLGIVVVRGSSGIGGVGLDFRRDGVKNKRLFRSFVGVVSSLSSLSPAAGDSAAPRATEEVSLATVADGGVESAVNAILEASSNGVGLAGESAAVDR